MIQCLYSLWETERVQQLNERDYTTLAYELALRIPEQGKKYWDTTPTHPQLDRLRQFDFISRAMTADTLKLDSLSDLYCKRKTEGLSLGQLQP